MRPKRVLIALFSLWVIWAFEFLSHESAGFLNCFGNRSTIKALSDMQLEKETQFFLKTKDFLELKY